MAWVGKIIALSKPVEGGHSKMSQRDHLRGVWKGTGVKPAELDYPEPPEELRYLWEWVNHFTHPLSIADLKAWSELTEHGIARWEIEALVLLDRVRANG